MALPRMCALIAALSLYAQELPAQALYELDPDGALTQRQQEDATVRGGYFSQPVIYSLAGDGTLTGSNDPRAMPQQPGAEVALATSPGRRLEVVGRIVNVRAGPDLGAAVRMKMERGTRVISLEHNGSWVRVGYPDAPNALGWMYEPLLAEVFAYSGGAYNNTPLGNFQRALEELNESATEAQKYSGLTSPEIAGKASMSLIASEAWLDGQARDRWGAAMNLGRTWRSLAPPSEVAVLNIVNEQGERQMTVIRP